jgi:hypothetical protein
MSYIETDRLLWAVEHEGYYVRLVELPHSIGPLYPKRELLLGAPSHTVAATRIAMLPTIQGNVNWKKKYRFIYDIKD